MPYWENADFRLEIEEVVGNENSLDLGTNVSVTRRFQVMQAQRKGVPFEPIPFALANLIFYDYIMQFEPYYVDLPFQQIRFVEDKNKIGEIFDAEVVYAFDTQTCNDGGQEFTMPTFSLTGGKKKQLLQAKSTAHRLKRYVKEGDKAIEYKMIGWDGKKFNGVEIEAPESKFMVPAWYPVNTPEWHPDHPGINFDFIRGLMKFIGTVNSKSFYGLKPGECKYLGPEQSWVTRTVETDMPEQPVMLFRFLELQHQFQVQLGQKDVKVGDITIPEVAGWDYVDVHYEESLVNIGDGNYVPLAVAKQVDVVPIYEEQNLWDLFDCSKINELGKEDAS